MFSTILWRWQVRLVFLVLWTANHLLYPFLRTFRYKNSGRDFPFGVLSARFHFKPLHTPCGMGSSLPRPGIEAVLLAVQGRVLTAGLTKRSLKIRSFLCVLAFFTWHNIFEVHRYCSMYQHFIPFIKLNMVIVVEKITFCLSIHPLMDTGVDSALGCEKMLLWTFAAKLCIYHTF